MTAQCKIFAALLAITAILSVGGTARAEAPIDGGIAYDGSSYGGLYYYYRNNPNIQPPPHFALHPPVYYSYPVPRTYGYSPFAYPASVMTPAKVSSPMAIINPYVPQKSAAQPTSDQTAAQTLLNPFATNAVAAKLPTPQVVFPAKFSQ